VRIGTRGSKLALIQTQSVVDALKAADSSLDIEIIVIQTSGDWKPSQGETLLSEAAGGKGLFAKEIEMALLDDRIDIGVHSLKDVPTFIPDGLVINHVMKRDDPRDAFICYKAKSLDELPKGATIGTSSTRRAAILLACRPDLKIVPFRGNVSTRLHKLKEGQVDATILAVAGLNRMGLIGEVASYFEPEVMLPAVCQGIIAMETRKDDTMAKTLLDKIHHAETGMIATAERSVLAVLDGSCRTPIGSYAQWLDKDTMRLRGLVTSPDGANIYRHEETTIVARNKDAHALGVRVGEVIRAMVPSPLLQAHG